jgi:hypothetical protein
MHSDAKAHVLRPIHVPQNGSRQASRDVPEVGARYTGAIAAYKPSYAPLYHQVMSSSNPFHLLQSLASKGRKDEAGLVDVGVVVSEESILLLGREAADGDTHVAVRVLAAHHEANLAGGVGGDRGVGVLGDREDLLAVLLELGDQGEMEPLVLGC